jgi:hypothetical protein
VQVWYGPKPGDPVKPPERPGSLTGIDLDTIQIGGWWAGVPAKNGPPWLPAGREIWLSSAADPVTGIAWQMATTQAVAGADSQVWLRQRVGGSWTAWRWQSGGLPDAAQTNFTFPVGTSMAGTRWHPHTTVRFWSPVPVMARVELHMMDVTIAANPQGYHTVYVGAQWVGAETRLAFHAMHPYASGHLEFSVYLNAGTTTVAVWTSGTGGSSFTANEPNGMLKVRPIAIADGISRFEEDLPVALPDPPEPTPIGGVPPVEPAPAPAPPVVI